MFVLEGAGLWREGLVFGEVRATAEALGGELLG